MPKVCTDVEFDRYIEYLGFQFVPGDNTIFNEFVDKLIYKVNDIGDNDWSAHNKELKKSQKSIFERTTKNFNLIKEIIKQ